MRVLTISPAPLWDVEEGKGMPSLFLGQRGFVDAGHEAIYAYAGPRRRSYEYHGIRMEEFRVWCPIVPERYLLWHRLSLKLFWLAFLIAGVVQGLRLTWKRPADVVYGHFMHGAPVAWILGLIRGIPNVTRMFGTFLYRYVDSLQGRLRKIDEVLAFKIPCSYLIMTNDGTRGDDVARELGVPAERLKFWRNGIDRRAFNPDVSVADAKRALGIAPQTNVLVAVSRLSTWKRVDRLIDAMPAVLAQLPDTMALIVGDGEDRPKLEQIAKQLGIADRVRFVGLVAHEEVPRYLAAGDIFVSLYDVSNVGNPLLEAMSAGKCVVTLSTGATAEINRNGEAIVLIDPREIDRLPGVLVDLLRDPRRKADMAARSAAYSAQQLKTWPERVAMEVRLIEELVARRPRTQEGAQAPAPDVRTRAPMETR